MMTLICWSRRVLIRKGVSFLTRFGINSELDADQSIRISNYYIITDYTDVENVAYICMHTGFQDLIRETQPANHRQPCSPAGFLARPALPCHSELSQQNMCSLLKSKERVSLPLVSLLKTIQPVRLSTAQAGGLRGINSIKVVDFLPQGVGQTNPLPPTQTLGSKD